MLGFVFVGGYGLNASSYFTFQLVWQFFLKGQTEYAYYIFYVIFEISIMISTILKNKPQFKFHDEKKINKRKCHVLF